MKDFIDYNLSLDRNTQIIGVLSRYIEVWNKVSKFKSAVDQLKSNQKKMLKLNDLLCKDIASIENEKHDRRKELEDTTMTAVIGDIALAALAAKCMGSSMTTGATDIFMATVGVRAAKAK